MGTDIHAAIEFKDKETWKALLTPNKWFGKWEGEPEQTARLDINRNYNLFSILGNVRNSYGFAGCDTGGAFEPMSDGRGVPEDISPEAAAALSGEHSATFVTLKEILEYDWLRVIKHRGWVNGPQLQSYERAKSWNKWPEEYCGGVSGPNISHITQQELQRKIDQIVANCKEVFPSDKQWEAMREAGEVVKTKLSSTYCQLEWETTYADCVKQFWAEILPQMLKLGAKYGYENVRLVMDFDS